MIFFDMQITIFPSAKTYTEDLFTLLSSICSSNFKIPGVTFDTTSHFS